MGLDFIFEPLVPDAAFALIALTLAIPCGLALWRRARGAITRSCAALVALLLIANPLMIESEGKRLPDVVAIVVDTSASQDIGERAARTREARAALETALQRLGQVDVRVVESGTASSGGTQLFSALTQATADVPPERMAGTFFITDGQVHDVPGAMPVPGPLHVLLSGERGERDRKLTIEEAPRFAIADEPVSLRLRVDDLGSEDGGVASARITLTVDGEPLASATIPVGQSQPLSFTLPHPGENVVEIEVEAGPDELTLYNNRAVIAVNVIRDRLRVLLVSGEPHPGERTWRDLLKADPSVDLVHFTILRPPEKQDATPIEELSLIAFPTRELFVDKLDQFDLVIFDRYQQRGILPFEYYTNLANYVRDGGAILVAAGTDYASPMSLYLTDLGFLLPARPTGEVVEQGFKPEVTNDGARHPVTQALPGANQNGREAQWGRWFREVVTEATSGRTLMAGAGHPLLVLDRAGEGRVAMLLSDHAWLWTRGFEGGGPQAELLRRLAHWLMKEPDLEEERLSASAAAGVLTIRRHSMEPAAPQVTVTSPSGVETVLPTEERTPGIYEAAMAATELGLYRITDGTLTAVAASGPLNLEEYDDVRTSGEPLAALREASNGGEFWLPEDGVPSLRRVERGRRAAGNGWAAINETNNIVTTSMRQTPLMNPWASLALALGLWFFAWRREGR